MRAMPAFQDKILEGLDLSIDLLGWIPLLEDARRPDAVWPLDSPVRQLGPASFGRVAMAAVEQYAIWKKLNPGTAEPLRLQALNIYFSAQTAHAYAAGRVKTMELLSEQKPELIPWLSSAWHEAEAKYFEDWRDAAAYALEVLRQIESQNVRKGKRGNPGRGGTHPLRSLDAMLRDFLDEKAIDKATDFVPVIDKKNIQEVRAQITPAVRDFLTRGLYGYDPDTKSLQEAIDQHARRVLRKFDERKSKIESGTARTSKPDEG